MGILEGLGAVIILASCTSMATTPVTAPIWFIVGLLFLSRPGMVWLWRTLTAWHMLSWLCTALYGLMIWIDSWDNSPNYNPGSGEYGFVKFVISALIAGLSGLSWQASRMDYFENSRDNWYVILQMIVAVIAAIYTISLFTDGR